MRSGDHALASIHVNVYPYPLGDPAMAAALYSAGRGTPERRLLCRLQ